MPAGSYDPDQEGPQGAISYNSPFQMKLPDLPSQDGTLNVTSTRNGFSVIVGGWTGADNQTRRHEFEVLYSSEVDLTTGIFDQVPLPSTVERRITRTGRLSVAVSQPTVYSVGVRPVQNGQGVGTPILRKITSGGGGVVPQDQIIFAGDIDVRTSKFVPIITKRRLNSKSVLCRSFNPVTNQPELVPESVVRNKTAVFPVNSTDVTPAGASWIFAPSTSPVVVTPSFAAGGAPLPGVIKFVAASKAANAEGAESTWARAYTAAFTLGSGQAINLNMTAAFSNSGSGRMLAQIINNANEEVLSEAEFTKGSSYPTVESDTLTLGYDNKLSGSINVRVEIKAHINLDGPVSMNSNAGLFVLLDSFVYLLSDRTLRDAGSSGTSVFGGENLSDQLGFSFGPSATALKIVIDDAIDTDSTEEKFTNFKTLSGSSGGFLHSFTFANDLNLTPSDEFYVGVSKSGRFITERTLDVEYLITRVEGKFEHVDGLSADYPGIIRVYPKGNESSAINLEIQGTGRTFTTVTLPITRDGANLGLVVDAFDSSTLPNNRAEITGSLIISGTPRIIDNITS